jgi:hypothetical protein
MPRKPCSLCGRPADISFVILSSTLRIHPRRQKSSHSVAYCNSCVRAVINSRTASDNTQLHSPLIEALTTCYHALTSNSDLTANPKSQEMETNAHTEATAQPTTSAATAVSCGPCLIASNSRKFTQKTSEAPPDNSESRS